MSARAAWTLALVVAAATAACDGASAERDAGRSVDAGSVDAGSVDAGGADAVGVDAGGTDTGSADTGGTDTGIADAGAADTGVFVDAFIAPDSFVAPDAFTDTYCVDIDISNTCAMTVTPTSIDVPHGQTPMFCWRNRSVDYPVDVWLSYGGGYTDLATGATWNEPVRHCLGPTAHDEYADISTACSSFRFYIHCL